jgi:hypothetical protein
LQGRQQKGSPCRNSHTKWNKSWNIEDGHSIDRKKWQRCFAFLQHNQLKGENSLRSGAHEETGRASPFSLSIRMLKQNRVYDSGAVKMQNIAAICCPTLFVCIKSLQVD